MIDFANIEGYNTQIANIHSPQPTQSPSSGDHVQHVALGSSPNTSTELPSFFSISKALSKSNPDRSTSTTRRKLTSWAGIDTNFYTSMTDKLVASFYPKSCCDQKLTKVDGKRLHNLRCPICRKQKSKYAGSPLSHMKLPTWMFSYVLHEAQIQFPKVLTTTEISKRLNINYKGAMNLKRRLQLFASDFLPKMQQKFYSDAYQDFNGFNFPLDRETDLRPLIKGKNIPQTDTVVLYSCSATSNKGRKRFKRTGQTASIYRSESLGGDQVGTLVNTFSVRNGPVFYDSISNQKASTLNPIITKYIPIHTPLFTDYGYQGYTGRNHRLVNHSLKSVDKRYRWNRDRWSKNGIHCQVAEGNNGLIKKHFMAYTYVKPKYSQLYLNEFSFLGNLRYFSLDDLLPDETKSTTSTKVKLDPNGELRELVGNIWRRCFHAQRRILLLQSIASSLARKPRPQTLQQNYQVSSP